MAFRGFQAYIDYLERYEARHRKQKSPFVLLKPVLGVLSGMPGQRHFRQALGKSQHNISDILVCLSCEIDHRQPLLR